MKDLLPSLNGNIITCEYSLTTQIKYEHIIENIPQITLPIYIVHKLSDDHLEKAKEEARKLREEANFIDDFEIVDGDKEKNEINEEKKEEKKEEKNEEKKEDKIEEKKEEKEDEKKEENKDSNENNNIINLDDNFKYSDALYQKNFDEFDLINRKTVVNYPSFDDNNINYGDNNDNNKDNKDNNKDMSNINDKSENISKDIKRNSKKIIHQVNNNSKKVISTEKSNNNYYRNKAKKLKEKLLFLNNNTNEYSHLQILPRMETINYNNQNLLTKINQNANQNEKIINRNNTKEKNISKNNTLTINKITNIKKHIRYKHISQDLYSNYTSNNNKSKEKENNSVKKNNFNFYKNISTKLDKTNPKIKNEIINSRSTIGINKATNSNKDLNNIKQFKKSNIINNQIII